jgi:hypothetical protein
VDLKIDFWGGSQSQFTAFGHFLPPPWYLSNCTSIMATPDSNAKAHALVYQFLELNGYTKTAASLVKEANEVAHVDSYVLKSTPEVPLSQMIQEHELNTLTTQIKNADLHR